MAQGADQYLASLGASPEVIQYILSQEDNSQILINEFRKNPRLTTEQLRSFLFPQKKEIDPYLERERRRATAVSNNNIFQQWVLVNYRKIRKGRFPPENQINRLNEVLITEEQNRYLKFDEIVDQIADWYNAVLPDIASYSPEQAIIASNEWHQMMAKKGEGKEYEPTIPQLTIYGPEWKNPEWNGWTIQKVISENDLLAEGNKMDHCVGDYCDRVKEGFSIIYSLRDPGNNPHITLETNDFHDVTQIQGKSNSIPKPEYRTMIKEWIKSDKNTNIKRYSDEGEDPFGEISLRYDNHESILNAIEEVISDDYGLNRDISYNAEDIMNMALDMEHEKREPSYGGDLSQIPEAIIDMIIQANKKYKNLFMPGNRNSWAIKELKEFEDALSKKEEEIWDWAYQNWDMSWFGEYPQEEDYETRKEFEKAEEEYRDAESDYMNEEIRKTPQGGFSGDGIKYLNKLREQGIIPSYDEMNKFLEQGILK